MRPRPRSPKHRARAALFIALHSNDKISGYRRIMRLPSDGALHEGASLFLDIAMT